MIKREEQNLIASVGIDIISLLDQKQGSRSGGQQSAPKAAGGAGAGSSSSAGGPASATGIGRPKKRERGAAGPKSAVAGANSLFVMCMKRLLPLGMSVLGGQEHELLQFAKARLIAGNYQEAEADAPEAPVPNSVCPLSDKEWELCGPENEYKTAKCKLLIRYLFSISICYFFQRKVDLEELEKQLGVMLKALKTEVPIK